MNAFMAEFSSSHFEVLAFPSNNFHLQEPGDGYAEILNGIKWVRPGGGYVPNFQMFKKIDVNGKNEHPLYTFLKSQCGPTGDAFDTDDGLYYDPLRVSDVRWNFEIFIISRTGVPIFRYSPDAPIDDIAGDIRKLINPPNEISNEIPQEHEQEQSETVESGEPVAPMVEPAQLPLTEEEEPAEEVAKNVEPVEEQVRETIIEEEEQLNDVLIPVNDIVEPVPQIVEPVYEQGTEELMQEAEEESNDIYPHQSPVY